MWVGVDTLEPRDPRVSEGREDTPPTTASEGPEVTKGTQVFEKLDLKENEEKTVTLGWRGILDPPGRANAVTPDVRALGAGQVNQGYLAI